MHWRPIIAQGLASSLHHRCSWDHSLRQQQLAQGLGSNRHPAAAGQVGNSRCHWLLWVQPPSVGSSCCWLLVAWAGSSLHHRCSWGHIHWKQQRQLAQGRGSTRQPSAAGDEGSSCCPCLLLLLAPWVGSSLLQAQC